MSEGENGRRQADRPTHSVCRAIGGKKPITRPRPTPPEVDRAVTESAQESGGRWEERGRWHREQPAQTPTLARHCDVCQTADFAHNSSAGACSKHCSATFTATLPKSWRRGNSAVRPAQGRGRPEPPHPQACEPARVCSYQNCLSSKQPTSCWRPQSASQTSQTKPHTASPKQTSPAGATAKQLRRIGQQPPPQIL